MIGKILIGLLLQAPIILTVKEMVKTDGWQQTLKNLAIVIAIVAISVFGINMIIEAIGK